MVKIYHRNQNSTLMNNINKEYSNFGVNMALFYWIKRKNVYFIRGFAMRWNKSCQETTQLTWRHAWALWYTWRPSWSSDLAQLLQQGYRRAWVRGFGPATFFRWDWWWNLFYGLSLPSADSRREVVSYLRKNVHWVLVNRLVGLSLPRKGVVRLTDRPNMTLAVDSGR